MNSHLQASFGPINQFGEDWIDPDAKAAASVHFLGVAGDGAVSPHGAGTVTEIIRLGGHEETLVFSETECPGQYWLTAVLDGDHRRAVTADADSPRFSFAYDASGANPKIIETIVRDGITETQSFAATSAAYALASDSVTVARPSTATGLGGAIAYHFSAKGEMTLTVSHGGNGFTQTLAPDPRASFTGLDAAAETITMSTVRGDVVEVQTFVGSPDEGYALSRDEIFYSPAAEAAPAALTAAETASWLCAQTAPEVPPQIFVLHRDPEGRAGEEIAEFCWTQGQARFEIAVAADGVDHYLDDSDASDADLAGVLAAFGAQIAALSAVQGFAI